MALDTSGHVRGPLAKLHHLGGTLALRLTAVAHRLPGFDRVLRRWYPPEVRLRHEFNRWAGKGLGANMERDHLRFTQRVLDNMNLCSDDRVLDLACGEGWACRLIAERAGPGTGRVVGLDVSDEMVRVAGAKSAQAAPITYVCGSADHIPCPTGYFTKVLSVASFIVFENQEQVLRELFRVLVPGGELFILTYLYKDRPDWITLARDIAWESRTGMSLHVFSAAEYSNTLESTSWVNVHTEEWVADGTDEFGPVDNDHSRALLITARTPSTRTGALQSGNRAPEFDK
jgi:ubiquinone/menaquinone biosynthesis C-methylase UbiE